MKAVIEGSETASKVVIITGAGGGLGRAMTVRLLRDGYYCVLTDKSAQNLSRTVGDIGDSAREKCITLVCDIRVDADRRSLIDTAIQMSGKVYGLVNNAGVGRLKPFLDESVNDWRETFETNIEAPFFLAQTVSTVMRKCGEGRIVNIASMHGIVGMNNEGHGSRAPDISPGDRGPYRCSAYSASKGGLIQLTRDLAAALGRWGITVNSVSPGQIPHGANVRASLAVHSEEVGSGSKQLPQTAGLGDAPDPDITRAMSLQTPLGRLGTVDEIAGPVSFLLSRDASYITGANLVVDGGFTIW
jgi:NAD(P)-dependent dehydrogenase (short-subunit alcohol dehydrogenase family)